MFDQHQSRGGGGGSEAGFINDSADNRPTPTFTNPFDLTSISTSSNESGPDVSPLETTNSELDMFRLPMVGPAGDDYDFNGILHPHAQAGDQLDLGNLMPRLSLEDSQA